MILDEEPADTAASAASRQQPRRSKTPQGREATGRKFKLSFYIFVLVGTAVACCETLIALAERILDISRRQRSKENLEEVLD